MVIGAMTFAQQPVVTPLWDHSVAGTADWSTGIPIGGEVPEWMGSTSERGMAYHDGMLYIVSRNTSPHQVLILEGETGNLVDSIQIDTTAVEGGTFTVNDIAITPSGKILLANLVTNSQLQPFKVYMLEDDGTGEYEISTLLEWQQDTTVNDTTILRLGDGFAFFGDVAEGEDGYILVGNAHTDAIEPEVYKWDVQGGTAESTPEIILLQEVYPAPEEGEIARLGISPRLDPVDNERFWADGHSTYPALYNMAGELITTFSGENQPIMQGISGVEFFTFQGQDFILTPATNHVPPADVPAAMFQLFRIPEAGAEQADSIAVFPERGLGANTNSSYAAPMAVDVQNDRAVMFVLSPNNGIAAFELTMETDTTVVAEGRWNFSNEDFNTLGSLDTTTTVNDLTIWANNEYMVSIEEDSQMFDGMEFTHRLRLDTLGGFDIDGLPLGGVLSFQVNDNEIITIIAKGTSDEESELHLEAAQEDSLIMSFPLSDTIETYEYVYTGEPRTLYLYASDFGADIYYINIDSVATSVNPIADKFDVRVYPNPATDRVYIKLNKPTQVALYNLTGRMVKTKFIESTNDFINVSDLQPGMYFVKPQMSNDFSQKLIVR